jgi:hypothetical protein
MRAPIDLQQHPFLGITFSAGAVLSSASSMVARTRDSRFSQDPSHGGPRHRQLFPLGQQLGEVLLVHTGVLASRQRHDPAPLAFFDPVRGRPSAIPVRQSSCAVFPIIGQHPPDVSHTQTEQLGGLFSVQLSLIYSIQNQ